MIARGGAVLAVAALAMAALALAAVASLAASPGSAPVDTGQTRVSRYLMGTSMRVEVFGGQADTRRQAVDEAFAAIGEVDRLMSDYRDDSEVSLVNRTAAARPVPVSAPLMAVLEAADRVSRQSNGAFDVTIGPLAALWGNRTQQTRVPASSELAAIRPLIGFRNIVLNAEARTVHFARRGMAIDLSGIAVGFAAEVAAASLKRRGLAGLVDAGGSQYMVGLPPGKRSWSIGISHPDRASALIGALDIDHGAVSTSSGGPRGPSHASAGRGRVLDPRSLQPATASLAATAVSTDGTLANALARAVFVLGPQEGLALLDAFPNTWGVVAYRQPDGTVGVSVSAGHSDSFHPASTR